MVQWLEYCTAKPQVCGFKSSSSPVLWDIFPRMSLQGHNNNNNNGQNGSYIICLATQNKGDAYSLLFTISPSDLIQANFQ